MNLPTYLRAGYPGLAVISSEEARAEAEIASTCASLKRHLHAWSSTEGLVDVKEGRVTVCPDPLEALHEAFAEGRVPSAKDITEAMTHTVPLAQLMDGQIAALRHWAKGRAREAAPRTTPARNGRHLAIAN